MSGFARRLQFSSGGTLPDTTKPLAAVLYPTSGLSLSGTVTLQASATDNVGVTKVEFYLDGPTGGYLLARVTSGSSGVYSYSFDTTTIDDGAHTIAVLAYDAAGNSQGTAWVNFTVSNSPAQSGSPIDDAGSLAVGSASYTVPSGAIFVATSGNDTSGDGSQGSPYQTLSKAVSVAASGKTIVMRAGVYNEGSDTQGQAYVYGVMIAGGKQITIQNYPGEAVWFDGSLPVTGSWTQSGSTWSTPYDRIFDRSPTFSHGQADGTGSDTGAGGWFLTLDTPQACWPDLILYDGVQLTQVQSLSQVTSGTFYVDGHTGNDSFWFVGTTLYIGDNPSGHEIRYANKTKLLTTTGAGTQLTLRGVGVRRYATYNAGFSSMYLGMNTDMENVWFEDVSASAIGFYGGSAYNLTKITARRIGFNFSSSNQSDNIVIDRCDLQQCNYAGFNSFGPSSAAMKFAKCQYVTVKNSIISNNNTGGFWTDQTVNTPIIVNCLFDSNVGRSIIFETSSDGVVANCKIVNGSTVPFFNNDSDTTRLYNNVLSGNSFGVLGSASSQTQTSTSICQIQFGQSSRRYDIATYSYCIDPRQPSTYYSNYPDHQWTINYLTVVNNVIANPGVNVYSMLYASNNQDATRDPDRHFQPDMHPTVDSNVYHWGSNQPDYPWATANGYQQNFSIYFSLSAFQAGTSPELDTNSTFVSSNPLDANYDLTDTTLHNKGTGLPSDIAALIGQPAGTKHIGCFW